MWYAIYKQTTGALQGVVQTLPEVIPPELAFTELGENLPAPPVRWNASTHQFVPYVATKAEIEVRTLTPSYALWRMWADTHAEAVRRSAPAAIITALSNKVDAVWTAYVAEINAWRQAS